MHLKPDLKWPKGLNTLCKEVKILREQLAMDRSVMVTAENEEHSSAGLFKLIFLHILSLTLGSGQTESNCKRKWLQILVSTRSKDSHVLKVDEGPGKQDEVQKYMLLYYVCTVQLQQMVLSYNYTMTPYEYSFVNSTIF